MSKMFLVGSLATLLCASLAAQAPQQTPSPDPSSSPSAAQPRTGPADTPQTPSGAAQQPSVHSSAANTITVEGCIQRSASASATAGAAGTAGSASSDSGFVLASVARPAGTSGSSASAPIASSYRLDADASKLTPHVGHKVEISGTVEPASGSASSAMAAPRLKVDNVKMVAATCTP